mmetsp:Transcript_4952/g.15675  ORF Transcript_4952/g.15675 Transcript_4952/m.15675 type:complete len:330 (+) Transcript_4952:395-1384(+)
MRTAAVAATAPKRRRFEDAISSLTPVTVVDAIPFTLPPSPQNRAHARTRPRRVRGHGTAPAHARPSLPVVAAPRGVFGARLAHLGRLLDPTRVRGHGRNLRRPRRARRGDGLARLRPLHRAATRGHGEQEPARLGGHGARLPRVVAAALALPGQGGAHRRLGRHGHEPRRHWRLWHGLAPRRSRGSRRAAGRARPRGAGTAPRCARVFGHGARARLRVGRGEVAAQGLQGRRGPPRARPRPPFAAGRRRRRRQPVHGGGPRPDAAGRRRALAWDVGYVHGRLRRSGAAARGPRLRLGDAARLVPRFALLRQRRKGAGKGERRLQPPVLG